MVYCRYRAGAGTGAGTEAGTDAGTGAGTVICQQSEQELEKIVKVPQHTKLETLLKSIIHLV
jgi:hypothetical protein